jgi:hypothetical protein
VSVCRPIALLSDPSHDRCFDSGLGDHPQLSSRGAFMLFPTRQSGPFLYMGPRCGAEEGAEHQGPAKTHGQSQVEYHGLDCTKCTGASLRLPSEVSSFSSLALLRLWIESVKDCVVLTTASFHCRRHGTRRARPASLLRYGQPPISWSQSGSCCAVSLRLGLW